MNRLAGKVAIITGGNSGIGRAVALGFADEGADVAVAYIARQADADALVDVIEKRGRASSRSDSPTPRSGSSRRRRSRSTTLSERASVYRSEHIDSLWPLA